MPVRLPIASWSICAETRLNISIQVDPEGLVIQFTGNDPVCCKEYGPFQDICEVIEEINHRFGHLIERSKTI